MAIKECSLYRFLTKSGPVATTPKDIKARVMASRVESTVNHGATRSITIDLSVPRVLLIGHPNTTTLRGIYIITTSGIVAAVMDASDITVSCAVSAGVATLTMTSSASTQSNARCIVI